MTASREGGASLTILSGIVAGNFSAFWKGMLIAGLMAIAYFVSQQGLDQVMRAQLEPGGALVGVGSIFAFGWSLTGSCAWARSTSPWTATDR